MASLPEMVSQTRRVRLGVYKGLNFGVVLHAQYAPEVYLEGATVRQDMLSLQHQGPRAVLNALGRLAGGCGREINRVRQDLAIAEGQLRDYQARLGRPFVHGEYVSQLTTLRGQPKAGLAGMPAEEGSEPLPVVEFAGRIKALKAGHNVDAPSERAGKRPAAAAEEPVTARIRRRATPAEAGTDLPDSADREPAEKTHVERQAREEQREHEPGLG